MGDVVWLAANSRFTAAPCWLACQVLELAMARSGQTPTAFAAALGVDVGVLQDWRHGRATPPGDVIIDAIRIGQVDIVAELQLGGTKRRRARSRASGS